MNIRQKMLLGAALLTLIPVALTATFVWLGSSQVTHDVIDARLQSQFVNLVNSKRDAVVDEVNGELSRLQTLGVQPSTAQAMRAFKTAFASAAKDNSLQPEAAVADLAKYTNENFLPEFAKRNADTPPDMVKIISALSPSGLALQQEYIALNPNPIGQKDKLVRPTTNTAYAQAHAAFHPALLKTQKISGFYDLFLIDTETDTIVYSALKELDFATSLANGVAAGSKLAEVYNKVKKAESRDGVVMSDFAPYTPSYNDSAAFAAVPIFDGETQIGVLAMQYPIDRITDIVTSSKGWDKLGLGRTGDIYVVGSDKILRTNARGLQENKVAYVEALGDRISASARANILKKDSTIGLVPINLGFVQSALAGESKVGEFTEGGNEIFAAYSPLRVQGLNWALVATMDEDEADESLEEIEETTLLTSLAVAAVVALVAGLGVTYFLRKFLAPIQKLSTTVQEVASGNTSARTQLTEQDEIGDLGRAFDGLLDDRIGALEKAAKENETLNNSVIDLLQAVFQLSNRDLTARAPVTEDIIGTVASSINQFSDETGRTLAEVQDIAQKVAQTSEAVRVQSVMVEETARAERDALQVMSSNLNQATDQLAQVSSLTVESNKVAGVTAEATQNALQAVQGTVQGMDQLRDSISDMEKRFKRLGERSQEISTAVQLINAISERTHVLALNAAMQAASAGEAGRGFAVVAEEVQRLSDSSRQATATISQLVGNIQAETNETLFTVNRLIGDVVRQTELAQRAGVQMNQTQQTTQQLVGLVRQIAQFSEQQAQLAATLQQSVLDINAGTEQTSTAIAEQTGSTQDLAESARKLTAAVGQFKLA